MDLTEDDMKKMAAVLIGHEEPSAEEVLYWATPYYEILMAEKEERQQRLKEEKEFKHG